MPIERTRFSSALDLSVSLSLALCVVLYLTILVDLLVPPSGTVGQIPNFASKLLKVAAFIGIQTSPTIFSIVLWPIHLRRKRKGLSVPAWFPFAALASAVWMWFFYWAIMSL